MKPFEGFYRLWGEKTQVLPTQCFALGHRVSGCVSSRSVCVWPPPPPQRLERDISTRGSAATQQWEWERVKKRDITEVKCLNRNHAWWVIWLATGWSRWRLLYFNKTLQRRRRRPPPPSLVSAPGCRIRVHEKWETWWSPLFHKLLFIHTPVLHLTWHCNVCSTIFYDGDYWCTFTNGSLRPVTQPIRWHCNRLESAF